ncbi:hypothetical protein NC796_12525 [Aliifodinibius sp. S!AR15-10]|uniref:DUF6787 family protein n=1 Tax=Aliifodinibius sp. S!AR15-10 TaxID=2950437 RepID=UPI00285D0EDE|nr:DUF6787 family protein [Aliifodinibius sp. S!AR15-10]MDR8391975.1 hypothetical protein [Aliifodinibius sp. S!AR15-10]
MEKLFNKIQSRWGIQDYPHLAKVLLIFAIAGLTALYVRTLAFRWLEFNQQTPLWEEAVAWVVFVIPSYNVVLLLYSSLLGQFDFFWRFQRDNYLRIKDFVVALLPKF